MFYVCVGGAAVGGGRGMGKTDHIVERIACHSLHLYVVLSTAVMTVPPMAKLATAAGGSWYTDPNRRTWDVKVEGGQASHRRCRHSHAPAQLYSAGASVRFAPDFGKVGWLIGMCV